MLGELFIVGLLARNMVRDYHPQFKRNLLVAMASTGFTPWSICIEGKPLPF